MDKSNIRHLDIELTKFIEAFFQDLQWTGTDSSAAAPLILDRDGTIDDDLMNLIGKASLACSNEEFALTIRPDKNLLIVYYYD